MTQIYVVLVGPLDTEEGKDIIMTKMMMITGMPVLRLMIDLRVSVIGWLSRNFL